MTMKKTIILALSFAVGVSAFAPAIASAAGKNPEKRFARLIKKADMNGDSRISTDELSQQIARTVAFLDADKDGALSLSEIEGQKALIKAENKKVKEAKSGQLLMKLPKAVIKNFAKLDADGNGKLTPGELDAVAAKMFAKRDRNKDGFLSIEDFAA